MTKNMASGKFQAESSYAVLNNNQQDLKVLSFLLDVCGQSQSFLSLRKNVVECPQAKAEVFEGATTISIMTLSIMALSIMTLSIMALSIITFNIMTLSLTTLSITTFGLMTLSIRTLRLTTLGIVTFSILTLSMT